MASAEPAERDNSLGTPTALAEVGEGAGRLPEPLTPLVGRRRELAALAALLADPSVRLLTLTGPGGVGKSRLALAAARAAQSAAPGPVAFAPLAPLRDPALLLPALAAALGVAQHGERPLLAGLAAALAGRPALLVLDNCEQLLAAAPRLGELLAACPALTLLATSRAPLRLSGEHVFHVPPLTLPPRAEIGGRPPSVGETQDTEAVRLFAERAGAARAGFALTPENTPTVVEICRRLDGLPLAIELAAARLRHLSPDALLARLERRLDLLEGGPRDHPRRLQTMRDAIGWSYDLLTDEEQTLFRYLAVFVGGFTLDAAEQVGRGSGVGGRGDDGLTSDPRPPTPDPPVLDLVAALVEVSLLRLEAETVASAAAVDADGPRYTMLETVREFALELLSASGEETSLRAVHAAYFADLVTRAAPALRRFNPLEGGTWRGRLAPDEANLRAALSWYLADEAGDAALRLADALGWFWFFRGRSREGQAWLDRALVVGTSATPALVAKGRLTAAWLAWEHGDRPAAIAHATAALATFRDLGDDASAATALHLAGMACQDLGDLERGDALLAEALDGYRGLGSAARAGQVLADLAAGRWATGDLAGADALFGESLNLIAGSDEPLLAVHPLTNAGGRALERGELDAAADLLGKALAIAQANEYTRGLPGCFENIAALAMARGEATAAARLLATADALRETIGRPVPPLDRARHEGVVAAVRARLGEPAWTEAWVAGRHLSRAEAVVAAEAVLAGPPQAAPPEPRYPGQALGLTEREVEVLRLLVAGESNPEIAAALFISPGTVRTHVSNILAKLDAKSRTEAASVAHRLGLL